MSLTINFSSQQYDFYTKKGFALYDVIHEERNRIKEYSYFLSPEELNKKEYFSKTVTLSNKEKFLSEYKVYKYQIYACNAEKFNLEFLLQFFCDNLKHSKEIINNSFSYGVRKPHDLFNSLIDILKFDELLKVVESAGVRDFKLFENPLEIQKKLLSQCSLEQTHIFWNKFLKPRKTELNKPAIAAKYHIFLLNTFENVEVFTPYFQKLQALFKPVDINFLENSQLKTTTLLINLKQLVKSFHIGAWEIAAYEKTLETLTPAIKNFYNLEHYETHMVNNAKKHFRILFSHTNKEFNEQVLMDNMKDFFNYLKSDFNNSYDSKAIAVWLYQNNLNKSLPLKENKTSTKIKI